MAAVAVGSAEVQVLVELLVRFDSASWKMCASRGSASQVSRDWELAWEMASLSRRIR